VRFKSRESGGFQVFAVTGVNTISFGIKATPAARKGLLGFAVERFDSNENERYFMPGFKVFRSIESNPTPSLRVSTWEHPIQSFVWDDFTAKPDRVYEYAFHPIKGTPRNLDRTSRAMKIAVRTEPLFSTMPHDVFFNRGVASSQAYMRVFENKMPDELSEDRRTKALQWLSRDLDEAMLRFISSAKKGDALRCCFYEFHYHPVLDALKKAITRGVDVRIIIDAKVNAHRDKKGKYHPSFPRVDNKKAIRSARIAQSRIIPREARPNDIQHNKFMVHLKGKRRRPTAVWTGSTNLSTGGIHGQTNVGHWVRDGRVAERYLAYWTLLADDPGGRARDSRGTARAKNDVFRSDVEGLTVAPGSLDEIPPGATPVFSPRTGLDLLDLYVRLLDSADRCSCITLAFGVNAAFKEQLKDNTAQSHITFLLLEKADRPGKKSKTPFIAINASNNVYKAWGSFIQDPVYQWARETNARFLEFNRHVAYVHSKFLLMDPLGDDPIVVTGSANFSEPSTDANDENMVIIRGDRRVADIYFTEFNRLFNHYYFRAVQEATRGRERGGKEYSLFLSETDSWLEKYRPGALRSKRLDLFARMSGFAASDVL
jgi:phosphatidylserine/phosphatidylglycerophosphate/cardiolipin synthase-like enzyme